LTATVGRVAALGYYHVGGVGVGPALVTASGLAGEMRRQAMDLSFSSGYYWE